MIGILNALFNVQARAIYDNGGKILKFIGNGTISGKACWCCASKRYRQSVLPVVPRLGIVPDGILATVATVIAPQAVISRAFSLSQQGMQ